MNGLKGNHDFLYSYFCKEGMTAAQEFIHPRVSDIDLFAWFRGIPNDQLTIKDISLSRDKRYMQPFLYFFARTYHARHILEIGTADGSTTWPLLKAASEIAGGHVDSVDPQKCFLAHNMVKAWSLADVWTHHEMTSDDYFAYHHNDKPIEVAYIDGDHSYEGVFNDLKNVLRYLVPGGVVFLDEYQIDASLSSVEGLPKDRSSLAASCGTPRAVADVLSLEKDCEYDIMPLTFGCFGLERFFEWTEGGEVMIRKRLSSDWQPQKQGRRE